MGGLRPKAGHVPALKLIAERLRGEIEDIAQEPLPERWAELIHNLNEQERRRAAHPQADTEPRERLSPAIAEARGDQSPLMALRAAPAPTSNNRSLQGEVILIVQRRWLIARDLATAFEANGARVLSTNNPTSAAALADEPGLSAAILDSDSRAVCKKLLQRDIPFIVYTGRHHDDDECAGGPTVGKPASADVIVATVKRLLSK